MTYAEIAEAVRASGTRSNVTPQVVAYHLEMLAHDLGRLNPNARGDTREPVYIDWTERDILFAMFGMVASQSAPAEPAPGNGHHMETLR